MKKTKWKPLKTLHRDVTFLAVNYPGDIGMVRMLMPICSLRTPSFVIFSLKTSWI